MPTPRKLLTCLATALAVGAILAPAGASAATEVGTNCSATGGAANYTALQLEQAPGSSLPLAAPAAGVVTKWKVLSGLALPPGFTLAQKMRVFRSTGAPNQFQTVAESSTGLVATGQNVFETRIPVLAGDRFGAYGPAGGAILFCSTANATDLLGLKEGDVSPGTSATYTPAEKLQLALSVTIEPDADGDGFGDESQDSCPQNAALQIPCPVLKLKAFGTPPGKSAVRVLVAADAQASISVSASAKVKGKKGKGTVATQLTPVVQLVSPGELILYTINFNKALKEALKALPKKKSITLEIVAEGKSLAGASSSERLAIKVKGQAKPRRKAPR